MSRLRRSGPRKIFANASNNLPINPFCGAGLSLPHRSADHLRRPPGLLDLLQGRLRKMVALPRNLARPRAGAQDLEAVARLLDHSEFQQTVYAKAVAVQFL